MSSDLTRTLVSILTAAYPMTRQRRKELKVAQANIDYYAPGGEFHLLCERDRYPDCPTCQEEGMHPTHYGSEYCLSGSIASGGTNDHCSCDLCF